jgi:hypothetical protein
MAASEHRVTWHTIWSATLADGSAMPFLSPSQSLIPEPRAPLAVVVEMPVSRRAVLYLGYLYSRQLPATLPDSIIVSIGAVGALRSWLRFIHGYSPVVES